MRNIKDRTKMTNLGEDVPNFAGRGHFETGKDQMNETLEGEKNDEIFCIFTAAINARFSF